MKRDPNKWFIIQNIVDVIKTFLQGKKHNQNSIKMDNEIKLKKIIAAYNPFPYNQIDLSKEIKDKYVGAEFKDSLADDICNTWSTVDCTLIHNNLFSSINTGYDILEMII